MTAPHRAARRADADGEVAEWLKAAVSKTVMGHWPIESSNLSLSAKRSLEKPLAWMPNAVHQDAADRPSKFGVDRRPDEGPAPVASLKTNSR
jgi:hypothetical protein